MFAAAQLECVNSLPNDRIWPGQLRARKPLPAVRAEQTGEIMIWDLVAEQMIVPPVELERQFALVCC